MTYFWRYPFRDFTLGGISALRRQFLRDMVANSLTRCKLEFKKQLAESKIE